MCIIYVQYMHSIHAYIPTYNVYIREKGDKSELYLGLVFSLGRADQSKTRLEAGKPVKRSISLPKQEMAVAGP